MSTVSKFEDLICWQRARDLTRSVYDALKNVKDYGFRDQIQRASVSVMSNIAEGFERGTKLEFLNYLFIAKGSAGEVRAQLYIALDIGYLNIETFKYLNGLALDCSRLLSSFTEKLRASSVQGLQYKKNLKRGMSSMNKLMLEHKPEWARYYNSEKDQIDFGRMSEDKNKKPDV